MRTLWNSDLAAEHSEVQYGSQHLEISSHKETNEHLSKPYWTRTMARSVKAHHQRWRRRDSPSHDLMVDHRPSYTHPVLEVVYKFLLIAMNVVHSNPKEVVTRSTQTWKNVWTGAKQGEATNGFCNRRCSCREFGWWFCKSETVQKHIFNHFATSHEWLHLIQNIVFSYQLADNTGESQQSDTPQRNPQPEGSHILWPDVTIQSAPNCWTSTGMFGTAWQQSSKTFAPSLWACCAISTTGDFEARTLET